jgi:hypothetical protein
MNGGPSCLLILYVNASSLSGSGEHMKGNVHSTDRVPARLLSRSLPIAPGNLLREASLPCLIASTAGVAAVASGTTSRSWPWNLRRVAERRES